MAQFCTKGIYLAWHSAPVVGGGIFHSYGFEVV